VVQRPNQQIWIGLFCFCNFNRRVALPLAMRNDFLELSFEAIDIQKRDQSLCSLSEGKDGDPLAEVISPAS